MNLRSLAPGFLGGIAVCVSLLPSPVMAGGRAVLSPEIGFFSISGVDTSSDATAVVSSTYDYGLALTWFQPVNAKTEGFLKFGIKAFGMASPSSARVLNTNQFFTNFAIGFRRPLGGRLMFSGFLDYNQYLIMQSASTAVINLTSGRWPGAGINMDYLIFRIRSFQCLISLGGGAALPLDQPGYGINLSGEGKVQFAFAIKRLGVMFGPYARLQTVSSSIVTQYFAELGGTVLIGMTLGKQRGKYMFSFSPRK